jgi:hypothetical protein
MNLSHFFDEKLKKMKSKKREFDDYF